MSLKELLKEIPGLVWTEPHVEKALDAVKKLCQGSPFEQKALEHYFEACFREHKDIRTAFWEFRKGQNENELLAFGAKEMETKFPGATADELMKVTQTRAYDIKKTVQNLIATTEDVAEAFIKQIEPLVDEVTETLWRDSEGKLNGNINVKIDDKLHKMTLEKEEALRKSFPAYQDLVIRVGDFLKLVENYGRVSRIEAVNKGLDKLKRKNAAQSETQDVIAKLFEDYSR